MGAAAEALMARAFLCAQFNSNCDSVVRLVGIANGTMRPDRGRYNCTRGAAARHTFRYCIICPSRS
jgi:hypothetical protein